MSISNNPLLSLCRDRRRALPLYAFAVLALSACALARGETRCVSSTDALVQAVHDAQNAPEGEVWVIRVHTGTYQINGDLKFSPDGSHDNKSFIMIGGWSGANGQCDSQADDPSTTVIAGVMSSPQTEGSGFTFSGDNFDYSFRSIRFANFGTFRVDDGYCYALNICPDTVAISIEHVEFDHGEHVDIVVQDAAKFKFSENLIHHIHPVILAGAPQFAASPVSILITNNEDPPEISYNTFADIDCLETPGGVRIESANPSVALHHNIFQSTGCQYDLYIASSYVGKPLAPYFNLYLSIYGAVGGSGNVTNFNPQFVDAPYGDYRLQKTSPAVNAGATPLQAALDGFDISKYDIAGNPRPVGTRWDIGAYESNVNDGVPPVITVNSGNDVDDGVCNATHCSLREAINLANAQSDVPQQISFNIPGSCPQTILLYSPLPDITDTLTIDGYTQPGANVNDLDVGSDANICVLIAPNATGVDHALQVPTGQPDTTQLAVRGLAFGSGFYAFGSTGAAIELRAGSEHRIVGNAFGGHLPSTLAPIGSLARAILVSGTAKNAHIGTTDPADRNYLGNLSQNGIVLNNVNSTGHTIENNYIGVQPDGLNAQGNQGDGISASAGSGVTINGNTIAASDYGIALLGVDTKGFTITGNRIGLNALGFPLATMSNSDGITIALGSDGHVIGVGKSDDLAAGNYSNVITNNLGDGIRLAADAGPSNVIRGNSIFSNGKGGSGIGIDLGGSMAQLANDPGDADAGTNGLQNYPILSGSSVIGAQRTVRGALNTVPNASLRLDFYRSPNCTQDPNGANATTYLGAFGVNSGATGVIEFSGVVAFTGGTGYLTATATTDSGKTSELAPCLNEDTIFQDGTETPGL